MTPPPVDRKDVAERIVALSGMGVGSLARHLGVTISTLDRVVCSKGARESTYRRILPRLEKLEGEPAAYKREREAADAALLALLNEHADEREARRAKRGGEP